MKLVTNDESLGGVPVVSILRIYFGGVTVIGEVCE